MPTTLFLSIVPAISQSKAPLIIYEMLVDTSTALQQSRKASKKTLTAIDLLHRPLLTIIWFLNMQQRK